MTLVLWTDRTCYLDGKRLLSGFMVCLERMRAQRLEITLDSRGESSRKMSAYENIHSEIENIGIKYPIGDAVKQLRNANCYEGWQDELRYLMSRYEKDLGSVNRMNFKNEQWDRIWEVSASKSIEHIRARSKASDDIKHRLGNLMMLPPNLNSKLQDKPTKDKFDAYRKTGLLAAIKIAENSQWTKREIDRRENVIMEWAVEEWAD